MDKSNREDKSLFPFLFYRQPVSQASQPSSNPSSSVPVWALNHTLALLWTGGSRTTSPTPHVTLPTYCLIATAIRDLSLCGRDGGVGRGVGRGVGWGGNIRRITIDTAPTNAHTGVYVICRLSQAGDSLHPCPAPD